MVKVRVTAIWNNSTPQVTNASLRSGLYMKQNQIFYLDTEEFGYSQTHVKI